MTVVVCGAGPAGSLTALILARAGIDVRLLERARLPRDKMCGDTVNPGAMRILDRHGLGHALTGGLPVDGMIVTGDGVRIEAGYGDGVQGRAILRRHFDTRLAQAAADAGVGLEDGATVEGAIVEGPSSAPKVRGVRVRSGRGRPSDLAADLVVSADGSQSRVAHQLGLSAHPARPRRWATSMYFKGVADLTSFGEMHVRSDRYVGVAPLPGGLANVCVVTADRELLKDPQSLVERSVRLDRWLADRFAGARPTAPPTCCGPLAVDCPVPGMPGLLLAGDAAGFIDPMTGDGLRFALRGAELAAAEALAALEHGRTDAHLRLAAARARVFRRKWRVNRTLRSVIASPAALQIVDRGAALAPFIVRSLIRYAADLRAA